ncbi:MAG: hypothetical protein FWD25_02575 [Clostridia bacterium]|nr:hypothetical protein [Clostridia bacterium]
MLVSWAWVAIMAVLMAVMFVLGRALIGGKGWRRLIHAGMGVAGLLGMQAIWGNVSVNLLTLAVSGVLGLPGAVLAVVLTAI